MRKEDSSTNGSMRKEDSSTSESIGSDQVFLPYEFSKKFTVSHTSTGMKHTHKQHLNPTKDTFDVMKGSPIDVMAGEDTASLALIARSIDCSTWWTVHACAVDG